MPKKNYLMPKGLECLSKICPPLKTNVLTARREFFDSEDLLKKLIRFEEKIDIFMPVTGKRYDGNPFALGRTVGYIVLSIPVLTGLLAYETVKYAANNVKEKQIYNKKLKEDAKIKADEKAKQLAQEKFEETEELKEKQEITILTKAVSEADFIRIRNVDIPTDKTAIIVGLVDEYGKIAEIAMKEGKMVLFMDDNPQSKIFSAFFIDPETGNFEEIARVKSSRGIDKIRSSIITQISKQEKKQQERKSAELRNEQIMHAINQRQ